jgi:predicted nucleotidyltransferase
MEFTKIRCAFFQPKGASRTCSCSALTFGRTADVDVRVEFGPDALVGLLAMGRMQRVLADLFHHPFDLVPKDGLKPRIREAVLASTEVLYAG